MTILNFRCRLLTDIILNRKSATEGNRQTLDFIPGNNFLGIVASRLYGTVSGKEALTLFHTGEVRYGDAHPSDHQMRGLKVPASLFHPKLDASQFYVHHQIPNPSDESLKNLQLKQCRSGFYTFSEDQKQAQEITVERNFAIKSAYDKNKRHAKDEMMYGYESLEKGGDFYFSVYLKETAESYMDIVKKALIGQRRIGRSRTAQYGLVEIEEYAFEQPASKPSLLRIGGETYVSVYADGRLIFVDKYGVPTYRPEAADLGLVGEICWEKSQIRSFQYAPWNFKRQAYDTDRCGIEKGSVFVVKVPRDFQLSLSDCFVGYYQNEGFGKVIYNPDFLMADVEGKAIYSLSQGRPDEKVEAEEIDSPLLGYLRARKAEEDQTIRIYKTVNQFVGQYAHLYKGEAFASQWGTIRSLAMTYKGETLYKEVRKYLEHGIAAEKWKQKQRNVRLFTFMETMSDLLQLALINLASEMAKTCKR